MGMGDRDLNALTEKVQITGICACSHERSDMT